MPAKRRKSKTLRPMPPGIESRRIKPKGEQAKKKMKRKTRYNR